MKLQNILNQFHFTYLIEFFFVILRVLKIKRQSVHEMNNIINLKNKTTWYDSYKKNNETEIKKDTDFKRDNTV